MLRKTIMDEILRLFRVHKSQNKLTAKTYLGLFMRISLTGKNLSGLVYED